MTKEKVSGRRFWHTQTDGLIHRLAYDREARAEHSLRKNGFEYRHLVRRTAMRFFDRCKDGSRHFLAEHIAFLRTLHQRAHDVLAGVNAAEEIKLRFRRHLAAEYRRMAGVRDKVDEVVAVRKMARHGRCDIERH